MLMTTRICMITYRVTVRQKLTILDVHADISISDLEPVDELANVKVGNAGLVILVRVLADEIVYTLSRHATILAT